LAWLRSVFFLNERSGWAVGSGGTFLITSDGGETWKQFGKITNDTLRDVHFFDERRGWLLCERDRYTSGKLSLSYMLKTEDGGATWERFDLDGAGDRLVRFAFSSDGFGLAMGEGGAVWQLQEDGISWIRKELPIRYLILDGQFLADSNGVLVGGGGTVLISKGKDEWLPSETGPKTKGRLNSVFFLNESLGWTVGTNGQIHRTDDGGRSWTAQASGLTTTLFDVHFTDSRRGFAVGESGKILETTDGGRTWNPQVIGVRGMLERLAFVGRIGVAVGHGGLIIRYTPDQ
jgi:photosystem II stability/assembly factor-like uncharacterized protein